MNEVIKKNGKVIGEIKTDSNGVKRAYNYGSPVGTYNPSDDSVRVNGNKVGSGVGALYGLIEE
jgi:hypothetical protein